MKIRGSIDCHLHIVGNGSNGSGCRLSIRRWYDKVLSRVMLRALGIPYSAIYGDLDRLYVERVLEMVQGSSIERVVLLAHEQTYDDRGDVLPNFCSIYVPNSYVIDLAKAHPNEFLAGVSIHPGRPDAMDELHRCLEAGAALMKCLPNVQNINCSEPRYRAFWELMARSGLPLLAHTGGELSLPVYAARFADPELLRLPLECGVKVIAAHCGTSSLFNDPNYTERWIALLQEFPNLSGDNSGLQTPVRSKHLKRLIAPELQSRIVYGSDIPIPISHRWAWLRGLMGRDEVAKIAQISNPLERDVQIKRAIGFAPETFTAPSRILRLS